MQSGRGRVNRRGRIFGNQSSDGAATMRPFRPGRAGSILRGSRKVRIARMQTLLHVIEVELLIAVGLLAFAYGAVWIALRYLTGGRRSRGQKTE